MAPLHHHFEKSGWTRDAGRGPLLDHHHAAVPGRPVQPEAAVTMHVCTTSHVLVLGLGDPAWRWRAGARATARAVRVWDSREQPPQRGALRERAAAARVLSPASSTPRCSRACGCVLEEPGPGAARRSASRRCSTRRAEQGMPVQGELDLFARALADLRASAATRRRCSPSPAPTARPRHRADRLLVERCRQDGGRGRQHRPDAARHAAPTRSMRGNACPRSGCSSCRASSSTACSGFEPDAAAVLNSRRTTSTGTARWQAYAAAKARIFGEHADDGAQPRRRRWSMRMRAGAGARAKGAKAAEADAAQRRHASALDAPQRPGDFGLVVENGMAWLVRALEATKRTKRAHGRRRTRSTCSA